MESLVYSARMSGSLRHRKAHFAYRSQVREHALYIVAIAEELGGILNPGWAVEEIVYPMGGVG